MAAAFIRVISWILFLLEHKYQSTKSHETLTSIFADDQTNLPFCSVEVHLGGHLGELPDLGPFYSPVCTLLAC